MHKPTNKLPTALLDPQRLMIFPREIKSLYSNMNPKFVNGCGLAVQFFSSRRDEGTSTIARDFALAAAQHVDGPVLLLDFDWGQDSHFKHFKSALKKEGFDSNLESLLEIDLDLSLLVGCTNSTDGLNAVDFHPIQPWPRNRPAHRAADSKSSPPDRGSSSSTNPVFHETRDRTLEPRPPSCHFPRKEILNAADDSKDPIHYEHHEQPNLKRHQPQTTPVVRTDLPENGLILGRTTRRPLQDTSGGAPCILNRPDIWSLLRDYFRMIVVDSPPSSQSPDAFVISGSMDAVIIVVRAESTRAPVVADMRDRLMTQGAPLAGVVLNHRRFYVPQRIYRWMGQI